MPVSRARTPPGRRSLPVPVSSKPAPRSTCSRRVPSDFSTNISPQDSFSRLHLTAQSSKSNVRNCRNNQLSQQNKPDKNINVDVIGLGLVSPEFRLETARRGHFKSLKSEGLWFWVKSPQGRSQRMLTIDINSL